MSAVDTRPPCVSCGGPLGENNVDGTCQVCTVAFVIGTAGDLGRVLSWRIVCNTCGDLGVDAMTPAVASAGVHNATTHDYHGPVRVDSDDWERA